MTITWSVGGSLPGSAESGVREQGERKNTGYPLEIGELKKTYLYYVLHRDYIRWYAHRRIVLILRFPYLP